MRTIQNLLCLSVLYTPGALAAESLVADASLERAIDALGEGAQVTVVLEGEETALTAARLVLGTAFLFALAGWSGPF
ncbi:MAG: hypothetical protein KC912_23865 [Proteobacteria bacterium]|nr:hypothetical protein [Pseudomonadota bacterium]